MGSQFFDQYTYLHFAVGIIVYFWGISLKNWIIIHTLFEIIENMDMGILLINKYFTFWPGGKPYPDVFINKMGDTIGAIVGWLSAYYLDKLGNNNGWYIMHIK